MHSQFSRRGFFAATAAVAAGVTLDACSSSGSPEGAATTSSTVSQADIDKALKTPTTLTFWTWVPDISQEVAIFEKQYPAIKVNVVNPGQGTPLYTKLRTALDAGKGTPDLAQVEYQYVPTFAILNGFVDLRPYGAAVPLIMLSNPKYFPITVGLSAWESQTAGGGGSNSALVSMVVTGSMLSVIPLILAFIFLQRYWQSGLSAGAVKE
jgi:ABC-type glycerol-3-phosphate transport system substrate-binding protein